MLPPRTPPMLAHLCCLPRLVELPQATWDLWNISLGTLVVTNLATLPYFQAAFGNPWSSELGQEGIVKKPTQSRDCSDKTGFTVKATKNGYVVSNGNKDAIE